MTYIYSTLGMFEYLFTTSELSETVGASLCLIVNPNWQPARNWEAQRGCPAASTWSAGAEAWLSTGTGGIPIRRGSSVFIRNHSCGKAAVLAIQADYGADLT